MTALGDAKAHLDKSEEFLAAAEQEALAARFNAATSNAVTSAINAKDAMCLKLTGLTGKTMNHRDAAAELKAAGPAAAKHGPARPHTGISNSHRVPRCSTTRNPTARSSSEVMSGGQST